MQLRWYGHPARRAAEACIRLPQAAPARALRCVRRLNAPVSLALALALCGEQHIAPAMAVAIATAGRDSLKLRFALVLEQLFALSSPPPRVVSAQRPACERMRIAWTDSPSGPHAYL